MKIIAIISVWCILGPLAVSPNLMFAQKTASNECLISFPTLSTEALISSLPDGAFNATVVKNGKNFGDVAGSIWLGRKDDIGICKGLWYGLNGALPVNVTALFYEKYIVGMLQLTHGFLPFAGILSFNETVFSIQIINFGFTSILVEGVYFSSFLPKPTGPYSIGTKIMHLVDKNRGELLSDNPEDYREVMLQLWYPREASTQGMQLEYMGSEYFEWLRNQGPIPLFWIPRDAYRFVHTHAYMDASIKSINHFPVIFFSHGYRGYPSMYTSIIEELASHGFIVVAITHPYIAGITVFPDGRTIDITQITFNDENESNRYFEIAYQEVLGDIYFVYDYVTELNEADNMFHGAFDMNNVGIFGHSFGGGAAADICAHDERFEAGLALDGYFSGNLSKEDFNTSFLTMFVEGRFDGDQIAQQFWENLNGESYRIEIRGSAHQDFTDLPILLSHLAPSIPRHLIPGFGTIEGRRLVEIINAYDLAFFDVYLKGESSDILINLANQFEEVLFYYK